MLLLLLPALAQEVPPPHRRPQDGAVAVVCGEGAEEGGDGAVVGELLVWNVLEPGAGGLLWQGIKFKFLTSLSLSTVSYPWIVG